MIDRDTILACNGCEWVGWASDAVHFKHDPSTLFCPECNETTEIVTPKWFSDLRDELGRLLDTAEQALQSIDLDTRKITAIGELSVLRASVDFYRGAMEIDND